MHIKYHNDGGYFIIYNIIPDEIYITPPEGYETVIVISRMKSIDYGNLYGNAWLCTINNINPVDLNPIRMVRR